MPDVVWASNERLAVLLDEAGHLTGAPELAVEVLSVKKMSAGIEKLNSSFTHREGVLDCRLAFATSFRSPTRKCHTGIGGNAAEQ